MAKKRRGAIVSTRSDDVLRFMVVCNQHIRHVPDVPPRDVLRLRMRLIAEEFVELLEATFSKEGWSDGWDWAEDLKATIKRVIDDAHVLVDLPELADALIDLEYVTLGTFPSFGINDEPLWQAVHEANLTKQSGPTDPVTGKRMKPSGFVAPDIFKLLWAQGWRNNHADEKLYPLR
jgi:predicted HAD superfamily Cof-like phosphohydrolase